VSSIGWAAAAAAAFAGAVAAGCAYAGKHGKRIAALLSSRIRLCI